MGTLNSVQERLDYLIKIKKDERKCLPESHISLRYCEAAHEDNTHDKDVDSVENHF